MVKRRNSEDLEQRLKLGEMSIFIKTTGCPNLSKSIQTEMFAVLKKFKLDPALVKVERITEATKAGTQETHRFFYELLVAPETKTEAS